MSAPLMTAFRAAHAGRDAAKRLDERAPSGERVVAGRRSAGRAAVSETVLRQAVSEHLGSLFNTVNFAAGHDLGAAPEVVRSILNFGFPDVTARSIDEIGVDDIGGQIRAAIRTYEPRLLPASVEVARDMAADATALKVRFLVRAALDCAPLSVPVEFVADLESDTGKITIARR